MLVLLAPTIGAKQKQTFVSFVFLMQICLAYYQAKEKHVEKGCKEKKSLIFRESQNESCQDICSPSHVIRTASFNLKLASLLLVGLIRCDFMLKNQM